MNNTPESQQPEQRHNRILAVAESHRRTGLLDAIRNLGKFSDENVVIGEDPGLVSGLRASAKDLITKVSPFAAKKPKKTNPARDLLRAYYDVARDMSGEYALRELTNAAHADSTREGYDTLSAYGDDFVTYMTLDPKLSEIVLSEGVYGLKAYAKTQESYAQG